MMIATVLVAALTGFATAEEIKPREVMVAQVGGVAAPGGGLGGASGMATPGGGLGGTTAPTGRMAPTTPGSGATVPATQPTTPGMAPIRTQQEQDMSNPNRPLNTVPPTTPGSSTQQPGSPMPATGAPGAIP